MLDVRCEMGDAGVRRRARRVRGGRGFTLVEALVALVVIALVLPVMLQGIGLAIRLGADARLRGEAAQLAKGKLDELVATGDWKSQKMEGDFDGQTAGLTWTGQTQSWGDGTLSELDVTVNYTTGGKTRSVTVSTLVNPEAQ